MRGASIAPRAGLQAYNQCDMRNALIGLAVVAVLVAIVIGWGVGINNQLVGLELAVTEKWAQVQNVYQRRADLIPNLVETVKGFATQERTVLEAVTRARAGASGIQLTPEALNDPKANQNFLALQSQLEGTENRISVERMRFNEAVRAYNTRLRLFPGSFVARLAGFQAKAFFEAVPDAATPPKVKF
jgi:LemA protein